MVVEDAWNFILNELHRNIERFVPRRKVRRQPNKTAPWWSRKLKKSIKLKYEAWKKYSKSKAAEDYRLYANQRNKTTSEVRTAREACEAKVIANIKSEPKSLYKYIRQCPKKYFWLGCRSGKLQSKKEGESGKLSI